MRAGNPVCLHTVWAQRMRASHSAESPSAVVCTERVLLCSGQVNLDLLPLLLRNYVAGHDLIILTGKTSAEDAFFEAWFKDQQISNYFIWPFMCSHFGKLLSSYIFLTSAGVDVTTVVDSNPTALRAIRKVSHSRVQTVQY